jgi:hypothetical protein
MTQVVVDFPDVLFREAQAFAQKEQLSLDKLIISLLGEKLNLFTKSEDYLTTRASRGNRDVFLSVLDKAGDVEPDEADRI